jgi:signal transduction histidine kinase
MAEALACAVGADAAEFEVWTDATEPAVTARWLPPGLRLEDALISVAIPLGGEWSGGVFRAYRVGRLFDRTECQRLAHLLARILPVLSSAMQLAHALTAARRLERHRIAALLHQGPAQALNHALWELQSPAAQHTDRAIESVAQALNDVRAAIALLRGHAEPRTSVGAAIRATVEQLRRFTSATIDLELSQPGPLSDNAAEALSVVAIEALANSVRHSRARQIRVCLRSVPGGAAVEVADDGRGLDSASPGTGGGFGLAIMTDAVRAVGGRLQVASAPGRGTRVVAFVPRERQPRQPAARGLLAHGRGARLWRSAS